MVRALDCGSSCWGFESPRPPQVKFAMQILLCRGSIKCRKRQVMVLLHGAYMGLVRYNKLTT